MYSLNTIVTRLLCCLAILYCPLGGRANDLGVWGETYPIAEPNFLTFIHQRLTTLQQSGQLNVLAEKGKQSAKQALLNPPPLAIPTAHQTITRQYRPQHTLTHEVWLNATIHYPAGTTIYPLDAITLHETLIFIDGRSAKQTAFAKCEASHYPFVKIILTAGNIKHAITTLGRVYYDQQGVITEHLHIQAVPSVVNQIGHALNIQQFTIEALQTACVSLTEK